VASDRIERGRERGTTSCQTPDTGKEVTPQRLTKCIAPTPENKPLEDVHGDQVCRQIMQLNPEAKATVFSAMNDPDVAQRSFEVGASAFVLKGAGDGGLLSTVKRLPPRQSRVGIAKDSG
jgi:hypothetical protein